ELVDAPGRGLDWDAGIDRRLASRVLALTGGQDLAQDHLGDLPALDAGTLEALRYGDLAQVVGRQGRKGPVKGANRRAGRADDDDIVLHLKLPFVSGWTGDRGSSLTVATQDPVILAAYLGVAPAPVNCTNGRPPGLAGKP